MKKVFGSLIILILMAVSHLFAADWKSDLQASYEKKNFLIRGFYEGTTLHYDKSGSLTDPAQVGSWTTSLLNVEGFKWKSHAIEIKGRRLAEIFDQSHNRLYAAKTGQNVTLKIEGLDEIDEAAARKLVAAVLIGPKESLRDLVPDYWKHFVEHTGPDGIYIPEPPQKKKKGECLQVDDAGLVCYVGGTVKAPKGLHTPDPSYGELSRQNKIQGTSVLSLVVDKTGMPKGVRIESPIGFGLDDRAVAAVRTWTFVPATSNGEPVSVQIRVEVNFRIR